MTKDVKKLAGRIEELEAEVQRMKAQPREVHHHHYPQPYVVPQPDVAPWRFYPNTTPWSGGTISWSGQQNDYTWVLNATDVSATDIYAPSTFTVGLPSTTASEPPQS
jgi:hypothetical protein